MLDFSYKKVQFSLLCPFVLHTDVLNPRKIDAQP